MVIDEMVNDFNKPLMDEIKKQRINYYGQKTAESEQQMIVPIKKLSKHEEELQKTIESLSSQYNDANQWARGHITRKLKALNEEIKKAEKAEKDVSNYKNYGEQINIGPLATTQNPLNKTKPDNSWRTKK